MARHRVCQGAYRLQPLPTHHDTRRTLRPLRTEDLTMSNVDILAAHQRQGLGASEDSPYYCKCGARIYPATEGFAENDSNLVRRGFAFAAHQVDALMWGR